MNIIEQPQVGYSGADERDHNSPDLIPEPSNFSAESPEDAATSEVPGHRLYYTALAHFLSGFSRERDLIGTGKS